MHRRERVLDSPGVAVKTPVLQCVTPCSLLCGGIPNVTTLGSWREMRGLLTMQDKKGQKK